MRLINSLVIVAPNVRRNFWYILSCVSNAPLEYYPGGLKKNHRLSSAFSFRSNIQIDLMFKNDEIFPNMKLA